MSLIRTIVIAAAVIAVLPSDRAQQERLQQAVVDAAHWTLTFCERNGRTCETAAAAWETFKTKAEFAATVAYDVAMTHTFGEAGLETGSTPVRLDQLRLDQPAGATRGTLTPLDLEPGWRGTVSRKGI